MGFGSNTINVESTVFRGDLGSLGKIDKLKDTGGFSITSTSNGNLNLGLKTKLTGVGASASVETVKKAQLFSIEKLTSTPTASTSLTQSLQGSSALLNTKTDVQPIQTNRVLSASISAVAVTQKLDLLSVVENISINKLRVGSSSSLVSASVVEVATATIQKPNVRLIINPISSGRNNNFSEFYNPLKMVPPSFSFNLNSGYDNPSSNILRGGSKSVGYIPSFRALLFKQTGTYKKGKLASSGLDYRPITKGWGVSKRKNKIGLRL
jgi:hypothetical protein